MDENNNGPVPGIIGQDVESTTDSTPATMSVAEENGKIFDSSKFTGEETESLVLNNGGEPAKSVNSKPKGKNPFTQWQVWAIFSGVILASAAVAIFVVIGIYEGKVKNTEAIARYDAAATKIETTKANFEDIFQQKTKDVYDIYGEPGEDDLYPTTAEYTTAKQNCLGKYDVTTDDISFIDELKTGTELYDSGANVVEAKDRIERIVAGYDSASSTIENCREVIMEPIYKTVDISIGELEAPSDAGAGTSKFSQIVTVKNKSKRTISYVDLEFGIYDRNNVEVNKRSAYKYNKIKPGETLELDLYETYYVIQSDVADIMKYKPVLKSAGIRFAYEYK